MLNLIQRTHNSVQLPADADSALFLDNDGSLVLKDQDGTIRYLSYSETQTPKVYKALLTQTGTNAPVVTVLQNDLGGNITYAYTSVGTYTATATGLLNDTTAIEISGGHNATNSSDVPIYGIKAQGNNSFVITSGDALNQGLYDGILTKTVLTITRY